MSSFIIPHLPVVKPVVVIIPLVKTCGYGWVCNYYLNSSPPLIKVDKVYYAHVHTYLQCRYPNQVIQNFSVDCGNGMLAFFNVTELQLQEKVVRGSDGVSK